MAKTQEEQKNRKEDCEGTTNPPQALSEDNLSAVTGGGDGAFYPEDDPSYDSQFRFKVGAHAEYITGRALLFDRLYTDGCTIEHRGFNQYGQPCYMATGIQAAPLDDCWIEESRFE